jgi:Mg-chelatase subunit ChlD
MRDRSTRDWRARWKRMNRREKGIAVAMTAAMLTFVIPAAGLAVDASMLYGIRARLSMAADAAAVAAARSLSNGETISAQEESAVDTAQRFFNSNFPDGYLYSKNRTIGVAVAESALRTRTVTVDVSADAPSYFLRYLGRDMTKLRALGRASRRDVNLMLVLDRSGSLQTAGACGALKAAAGNFVKKFANYRDRVGLVTYGGDSRIDFPIQVTPGNFLAGTGSIPDLISKVNCLGATNTPQAMWQGYNQLKLVNEPGALNAIILFTDGQPNTLTFDFSGAGALRTPARGYTGPKPTSASTAQITAISQSGCNSYTGKLGWVQYHSASGRTHGLYRHLATALPAASGSTKISGSTGCVYNMSSGTSFLYGDVGFMPEFDIWGNAVRDDTYKTLQTITNAASPDFGKVRIDHALTMQNAGINATNHAALRIRNNETAPGDIDTVIYTIGLGGVGAAEDEMLNRVANTKASPIYDPSKQEGLYVYAPTATQLNEAFSRIAGEILRISR